MPDGIVWVRYDLVPMGKVRMTRADKWKKRPVVLRYRAFADSARAQGVTIQDGAHMRFEFTMPPSWSKKKRAAMLGQPHRQAPDLDNCAGALMDAVFAGSSDAHIASLGGLRKIWAEESAIWVGR